MFLLSACSNQNDVVSFTGTVESPKQIVHSQADGQLNEILQKEGEVVNRDDMVAQIDDTFYTYEVDEANAATKAITAEIKRLENNNVNEDEIEKYRFELEQAEAKLQQAKHLQSRTEVIVPTKGTITEWYVHQGDFVQVGMPLFALTEKGPMEVTIYVPQFLLSSFTVGAEVSASAISSPDETIESKIVRIADEAVYSPINTDTSEDKAKKVFPVDIEIEEYGSLKSGMDVIIEIN